jgi:hypothetical protein
VTSSGFTLNSGVGRKSNDFGSHKPLKIRDKINSNKVIINNGAANKFKRNEDESHESANEDSTEIYFSDEVYYYDDDEDDEDYDEDSDEYEKDVETDDNDVSEYVYDYVNDNGIADENHNGNKHEAELVRVTRKYVFEPSASKTTQKYYDVTNHKDKDTSEYRITNYVYDKVNNRGNNENDLNDDDKQYGERETHEDWPSLEVNNGVTAVADYVVDSAHGVPSSAQYGTPRCLFGWYLDANGVCAPPRNKCKPGLVYNKAGDCVGPDTGYWYK